MQTKYKFFRKTIHFYFLGSNDKSVIVWDVKGDLDLKLKLDKSSKQVS